MTGEKGNFRLPYYEKCGFRNEEKKSLETLLKDRPLDKSKLQKFCVAFSVPPTHRNLVWKLLLDVIPVYTDSHEYVMEQRIQEYKEIVRALHTLKVIDVSTPKAHMLYAVWLLKQGCIKCDSSQLQYDEQFILLAQVFLKHFDNDAEVYWLSKTFYEHISKYSNESMKLIERFWSVLEKEDKDLYLHLHNTELRNLLPLKRWFKICFAGVIHEKALMKIWDKICGGSIKILVFVTINLFIIYRYEILRCTSLQLILECIKNIPEDTAELIVFRSIEMWQKYGSPISNSIANI